MFASPAFAQATGSGGFGSTFGSLVPLLLIFLIMYFIIIRPQQKKAKEHKLMVNALKRGDQVLTQGGIIGKVSKIKDENDNFNPSTPYAISRAAADIYLKKLCN